MTISHQIGDAGTRGGATTPAHAASSVVRHWARGVVGRDAPVAGDFRPGRKVRAACDVTRAGATVSSGRP